MERKEGNVECEYLQDQPLSQLDTPHSKLEHTSNAHNLEILLRLSRLSE